MDWSRSSNIVDETALFLPLYSPTSWALSRVHRRPQDSPILNLARDDVTNPWLLIRQRNPWNFWPQVLELSLAFHYYSSYRQGTTHILREERGRWLLPSYMFVNLFVIYTGDPRRDDGDRPSIWSWFSLVGSHVGDYDLHFCFSTIYF